MKIKYLFIVAALQIGCSTTTYDYQVHLGEGTGTMHLVSEKSEEEAQDFIDLHEEDHGPMKIIKVRK